MTKRFPVCEGLQQAFNWLSQQTNMSIGRVIRRIFVSSPQAEIVSV